ncbi:MAG: hypothetical protein M3Z01_08130, partial [Thermoproteota archaeon]|nr:hypothetical protein [Thermoproteota archaeon]
TISLFSNPFIGSNNALSQKHKKHNLKHNLSQSIGQGQSSDQNLQCGSNGGNTLGGSCSNLNVQTQINQGDNALG